MTNMTVEKSIVPNEPPPYSPPVSFFGPTAIQGAILNPGHTYILWDRNTGLVLAMRDGNLALVPHDTLRTHKDTWHWECEEKGGWFSLRHPAVRMNIGYRVGGRLSRWAAKLMVGEFDDVKQDRFCYRVAPEGGHQLWWKRDDSLHVVVLDPASGSELHLRSAGPNDVVSWEFVQLADGDRQ
ncbi:hypothetical protein QC761_0080700 [Podospora bellae-mahoneyi]|uniref:Ricin B lectin domain-containing protein n=1 Tax=Podospora bellae-mahoneyi TaxID=2093777 RepID=A0ABR0FDN5_9PEZI|nr:hypothetical protein QC761_0080700 [Podospora bellae-mahoneyi]